MFSQSLVKRVQTTDEILELAVDEALKHGSCMTMAMLVVITAGVPVGEAGTTNLMKVHVIGDLLARGQGIGKASVVGKAVVAKNAGEALAYDTEGCILVTVGSDREMMPAIENCIGIITEEGGLTISCSSCWFKLRYSGNRWCKRSNNFNSPWTRNYDRCRNRCYL